MSQITHTAMKAVGDQYCKSLMISHGNLIDDPHYLVNIDETVAYMNCSPNPTIHKKGEKTVSVMIGGASGMRFTLAVSAAMDETKLPLFVIVKKAHGGSVEKQLPEIITDGTIGCVQEKEWKYDRTMRIWYDQVYEPYSAGRESKSGLLL